MNFNELRKHIEPRTILDIGANVGQFYLNCKTNFPSSWIYSIEANKDCIEQLSRVNPNSLFVALGNENKVKPFFKNKNDLTSSGSSFYREKTDWFNDINLLIEELEVVKLDDIFETDTNFDLIKIDTQGSEIDIMKGGTNVISNSKFVLLEVSEVEYNIGSPLIEEVNTYMKEIGFEFVNVLGENYHPITKQKIQYDNLYRNLSK